MQIRKASEKDFEIVANFIRLIAEYEKLSDAIIWDDETLYNEIFVEQNAHVLIGEIDNQPIGFALYLFNFSTFVGRKGLYLEDLFILEKYRKFGYGKLFFKELLKIAKEKNCGRMEWVCLDWNQPSINFYKSLGAIPMDEWTTYRLDDSQFDELIKKI